jgi:hypothetical protein
MKGTAYTTLFIASFVVAASNFVGPSVDKWWPSFWLRLEEFWQQTHHHTLVNPLASLWFEIANMGIWVALLVIALKVYGKRGLWLATALPFLVYDQFLLLLLIFNCGDWIAYHLGDSTARFLAEHLMLVYAGFWVFADVAIAFLIGWRRLGSPSHEPA